MLPLFDPERQDLMKHVLKVVAGTLLVVGGIMLAAYWLDAPTASPSDTVHIVIVRDGEQAANGSGVMIAPRLMLTAAHVVAALTDGARIEVGAARAPARMLRMDPVRDLALLMVVLDCPCAKIGNTPERGTPLVTYGHPRANVTGNMMIETVGHAQGIVRGGVPEIEGRLIVTTPAAPGNSGGGVFADRRLVGIVTWLTHTLAPGTGMFMPPVWVPVYHMTAAVSPDDIKAFLQEPPTPQALDATVRSGGARDGWTD